MASSPGSDAMDVDQVDVPVAVPVAKPVAKKKTTLTDMPPHIFAMIMGNLEPIWIYNVYHVCQTFRMALSYVDGGNRIWYDSLPSTAWAERATYQSTVNQGQMVQHLASRGQVVDSSHKITTAPTTPIGVAPGTTVSSAVVLANNSANTLPGGMVHSFPWTRLMGGPYEPLCNYARELIGRFKDNDRCNICLRIRNDLPGASVVLAKHWGVRWCEDCLENYTIDATGLQFLLGPDGDIIEWQKALSINNEGEVFLITEIERELLKYGYQNLKAFANRLTAERHQFVIESLLSNVFEYRRRIIRNLIVQVAEAIWEGHDVAALLRTHGFLVRVKKNSETYKPDSALYAFYRQRWAPTNKLNEFLFPKHLLVTPTVANYVEGKWLKDPSLELLAGVSANLSNLQPSKIVKATREMLDRMVATDYTTYTDRRIGRTITKWFEATTAYHSARVKADLRAGHMLRALDVPPGHSHDLRRKALNNLRVKLGLQSSVLDSVPYVLPERLKVYHCQGMTQAECIRKDRVIRNKRQRLVTAGMFFNRIVLNTWRYCPKSGGAIGPGLDGLLSHMETNHPEIFYASDGFGFNH